MKQYESFESHSFCTIKNENVRTPKCKSVRIARSANEKIFQNRDSCALKEGKFAEMSIRSYDTNIHRASTVEP
jgi:hypothetical protein